MNDESAAVAELHDVIGSLGVDELRVLARIAKRLAHGTSLYGVLNLARDERNFTKEAREEIEDFLVYAACRWLKEGARP